MTVNVLECGKISFLKSEVKQSSGAVKDCSDLFEGVSKQFTNEVNRMLKIMTEKRIALDSAKRSAVGLSIKYESIFEVLIII